MKKRLVKKLVAASLSIGLVTVAPLTVRAEELKFWNTGTEGNARAFIDKGIEIFNSTTESGYTIVSEPTQNDAYKEKIVIAMSSGECPDIYMSWGGAPLQEYVKSGYAKDVTELYKKNGLNDKIIQSGTDMVTIDGRIYGVPYENVSASGIYYNKKIFEELGLEVPETIGELETVCDTLVENGIVPFALANATKWTGSFYYMNLVNRYAGMEPFEKAAAGEGSFEDECFIWAGEKIVDWVKKGYFPEGVNSLNEDDGQARQLLYTGEAAMTNIGSWYPGTLRSDSEEFYTENIGWFPFPAYEGAPDVDPSIVVGSMGSTFISFNCEGEALEAAMEFASVFSTPEMVEYMAECDLIAPTKDAAEYITDPILKDVFEAAENASGVQLFYNTYLPAPVAQAHMDGLQEVFGLTKTPAEAQAMMQNAMDEYLADK